MTSFLAARRSAAASAPEGALVLLHVSRKMADDDHGDGVAVLVRVSVMGDWTNTGRISADVAITRASTWIATGRP